MPRLRLMPSAPTNIVAVKSAASTTPSGLQIGEHRDDDAGIAEAGRQIGRHVALHAHHLDCAGKTRQPAGKAGDLHQRRAERHAGKDGTRRIEAGSA